MTNLHRGEIDAVLGGRSYTLCLTLGALAELESAFGVDDLVALSGRFEQGALSARDILRILGCGLRGGGNALSNDEVANLSVPDGLQGNVSIAARLLEATFGSAAGAGGDLVSPT
jgi:hypothetical protein